MQIRPWMWPGVVAGGRVTMWITPRMWLGVKAGGRVTMWITPWTWLEVVTWGRAAKGTGLYFHLPYLELKQASFPLGSFCRLLCHTVPLLSPPQKTCGLCVCWIELPLPVFPHQPVCPEIPFSASEQIFLKKKASKSKKSGCQTNIINHKQISSRWHLTAQESPQLLHLSITSLPLKYL